MRKALIAALVLFILLAPVISFAAGANLGTGGQGLVPSQTNTQNPASNNFCTLLTVANNFINLSVILAIFVATVMFAYGGFLYVTAAAHDQIKKAHGVFVKVFFGIIIVLVAWLIVNIILSVLSTGNVQFWTQQACRSGGGATITIPQAPTQGGVQGTGTHGGAGTPSSSQPSGTLSEDQAYSEFDNAGIQVCSSGGSVSAGTCNVQADCSASLAAGKPCTSLTGMKQSTVDETISFCDYAGDGQCTITGGTEAGYHTAGSQHYSGNAVDIRWTTDVYNAVQQVTGTAGGGTDSCGNKFLTEGDHLHITAVSVCNYGG